MNNEQQKPSLTAVDELTQCIVQIRQNQERREAELLSMLGSISMQQLRVLNLIGELGVCTMTAIAEQTKNSLSSTTIIVNKLVQGDLVTRVRTEEDRRLVKAKLTSKGNKIYDIQIDFFRATSNKILETLTSEEQTLLIKIFKKIAQNV